MTGKCLRTLVGHTGGVWSSQMANNVIVSGSTDRTLKVSFTFLLSISSQYFYISGLEC